MAWAFNRTAYDPIITEMRDYGLALFDDKLRIVAESIGVPSFSGTLGIGIKTAIDAIGMENLKEGDIFCNNWPYWNGSQVNDMTIATPIFHKKDIIGYAGSKSSPYRYRPKGPRVLH